MNSYVVYAWGNGTDHLLCFNGIMRDDVAAEMARRLGDFEMALVETVVVREWGVDYETEEAVVVREFIKDEIIEADLRYWEDVRMNT